MQKIKTFDLQTGKMGEMSIDQYFFLSLKREICSAKNTLSQCPNIGTVKDGSVFAMLQVLEAIQNKALRLEDKHNLFTTFYFDLIDDIHALEKNLENTENIATRCVLLGQKQGYAIVKHEIEQLLSKGEANE